MKARNFVKIPLMPRIFAIVLLIAVSVFPITPQLPDHILRAREHRDHDTVIAGLINLRDENAASFLDRDLDYLLGRSAAASGRYGTAAQGYHSVVNRDSPLKPYAIKHLSRIARSTGNLMLERIYLTEVALESPSSLPSIGASIRKARNRLESGDHSEAIRLLENARYPPPAAKSETGDKREPRAVLGEAYIRAGDLPRAKDIFLTLIDEMPDRPDDHLLTAVRALDLIEGSGAVVNYSEDERFKRANIYSFNREFAEAKKHLEAVIAHAPTGPKSGEAVFQIGRAFTQQGDHAEALKWFERVLERYPDSAAAKDALMNAASAYSRVGKPREAISRYQSFIEKYPADEKLDRAYLNIVDVHRDQGEDTEALKWCGTVREVFRDKLPATVALFTEARIYMAREEWDKALSALEQLTGHTTLGGASVPGGTSVAEISFLRAFTLEQLKRYPESIEVYLLIPDGRAEYYGWRATERLRLLGSNETTRSFVDQKIGTLFSSIRFENAAAKSREAKALLRLVHSSDLRQKSIDILKASVRETAPDIQSKGELRDTSATSVAGKLRRIGIFDEAAQEFEFTANVADGYILAKQYTDGDRADRGLNFIEPLWRKVPADIPLEILPREQLLMLYPAPYADYLIKYGKPRNLDPRFILAIMRQESSFDPDAKSGAAARGLMQFISTTSTRIAGQLGRNAFVQEDLYHPPTAILFGSQYLSELFGRFPQQPEAVAASYNGGDDNMARWLTRSRSGMPELYVSEIVYSQTKDYVTKVMANYRVYQFLYDESLRPRSE